MKSFVQTSPTTLDITDENGNTKEWVRSHEVRGNDDYDFTTEMKIRGTWYVTTKESQEQE